MFILLNSGNGLHKIKLKLDLLSKQPGSWGGAVERKLHLQPQGGSVELREQVPWPWVVLGGPFALTIRLKPLSLGKHY